MAGEPDGAHPATTPTEVVPLRLVVASSSALPPKQRVAVLDSLRELTIGRDASCSHLRLRDASVSRAHAFLFWDPQTVAWTLADMGSTHGTFVGAGAAPAPALLTPRRGSPPRFAAGERLKAGVPRALRHADRVTAGGTTFVVHMHRDGLPCTECVLSRDNSIPLYRQVSTPMLTAAAPPTPLSHARTPVLLQEGQQPQPLTPTGASASRGKKKSSSDSSPTPTQAAYNSSASGSASATSSGTDPMPPSRRTFPAPANITLSLPPPRSEQTVIPTILPPQRTGHVSAPPTSVVSPMRIFIANKSGSVSASEPDSRDPRQVVSR